MFWFQIQQNSLARLLRHAGWKSSRCAPSTLTGLKTSRNGKTVKSPLKLTHFPTVHVILQYQLPGGYNNNQMVLVCVAYGSLHAGSWLKSVSLVWELAATWHRPTFTRFFV